MLRINISNNYLNLVFLIGIAFLMVLVITLPEFSYAQNSLGIGGSEQSIKPTGFFAGPLQWIYVKQQAFYSALRSILVEMKRDGTGLWVLVGLSFAYGVFHAAGPGHGKVVISSYMLANETAAKRGIFLSFASSLIQGMSAIVVAFLAVFILRGTGISYGNIQYATEIISYALITWIGIWLIWRKIKAWRNKRHVHAREHHKDHEHHHHHHSDDHDHDTHDEHCGCGHDHAVQPDKLEGTFSLKKGVSAILAVGLRPCSGALIVLIFTFLNGLYAAGIISVLAMSIGTGITVSTLAVMATFAKNLALKYSNGSKRYGWLANSIELLGAVLVFVMGISLLLAAYINQ